MRDKDLDDEIDLLNYDEWEQRTHEDIASEIRQFVADQTGLVEPGPGSTNLDQNLAMETAPSVWALLEDPVRAWVAEHALYRDLPDETIPLVIAWSEKERQRQETERQRQETERQRRAAERRREEEAKRERRREFNLRLRRATGVPDGQSRTANGGLQPLQLSPETADEFGGPGDAGAPTLLRRTDGRALIYSGLTHSIAGESESGKTWLALLIAKEYIETAEPYEPEVARALGVRGPCVGYLDFEQNPSQYKERLPVLGITHSEQFLYATPELSPEAVDADDDLRRLLNGRFLPPPEEWRVKDEWVTPVRLVIIDDVSQAMSAMGFGESNAAVTAWQDRLPNRLAARGITVVMLDHLVKANDGTGRYPLGGVMKLNGVTGAQYIASPVKPISPGRVGETDIRVAKDRPGRVRYIASDWRDSDKTERVGRLIHDARDPKHVSMRLEPPNAPQRKRKDFEVRVLGYVQGHPGTSFRELKTSLRTGSPTLARSLERLLIDNQIREEKGPRNARLFYPS